MNLQIDSADKKSDEPEQNTKIKFEKSFEGLVSWQIWAGRKILPQRTSDYRIQILNVKYQIRHKLQSSLFCYFNKAFIL